MASIKRRPDAFLNHSCNRLGCLDGIHAERRVRPHLKPIDKKLKWTLAAAAAIMAGVLAVTASLAEGDVEATSLAADRQAAEQGDASAQFRLGARYYVGDGVAQDEAEAARWYRLAAGQGLAVAQLILGFSYHIGQGVLKDEAEAARWYRLAAEQGLADAQYNLGVMYDNGQGVLKDEAEAVRWFRLAAKQGHASAQFNLGVSYANGQGVLKDSVRAHMWFNIASANGNEKARAGRDSAEKEMSRAEINHATELARTCMASGYQDCES